jgi:hypothetical protein
MESGGPKARRALVPFVYCERATDRFFLGRQLLALYPPAATMAIVPPLAVGRGYGRTAPRLCYRFIRDPIVEPPHQQSKRPRRRHGSRPRIGALIDR